jgi:hypothetical protein
MTDTELLVEAEAAYHALMTGQSVVECRDSNGESIRFSAANASRLSTYIQTLKMRIAGVQRQSGPLRIFL